MNSIRTAAEHYKSLSVNRQTCLDKARECSRLTVTGLIPSEGQNEHYYLHQPYTSVGTKCVNILTARLMLALFPANIPFFQFRLDVKAENALQAEQPDKLETARQKMADIGRDVFNAMQAANIRQTLSEILRHLIVAGNVLLHTDDEGRGKLYRIDQYVLKRDNFGKFMSIVVVDAVYPSSLPEEVQVVCRLKESGVDPKNEKQVSLYTVIERKGERVEQWQEINGVEVPDSRGVVAFENCGWLPLRWRDVPGSDWGAGLCGDYLGDLLSLDDLSGAIVHAAAEASRVVHLVDPASGLRTRDLAKAKSGAYLYGRATDVTSLALNKSQDLSVVQQMIGEYTRRLNDAFLSAKDSIRNAERVTAEEIRLVGEELETALGGVYTVLAEELQLPLVRRFQFLALKAGEIPPLPKEIKPVIQTGFEALGRQADTNVLRQWIGDIAQMIPQGVATLKADALIRRLANSYGVENPDSLIKSAEEQQAETAAAAQQQVAMNAAPEVIRAGLGGGE